LGKKGFSPQPDPEGIVHSGRRVSIMKDEKREMRRGTGDHGQRAGLAIEATETQGLSFGNAGEGVWNKGREGYFRRKEK
jgi:hypothetical protein